MVPALAWKARQVQALSLQTREFGASWPRWLNPSGDRGDLAVVAQHYAGLPTDLITQVAMRVTRLQARGWQLQQMVLDRRTLAAKDEIAPHYADLVYEGRWWSTEREAYDAFVNVTQQRITGEVGLRLFKGTSTVTGRKSRYALYDERFVTFGEDDVYQQSDAAGFIRLYGLPTRVRALRDQDLAEQEKAAASPESKKPAKLAGV